MPHEPLITDATFTNRQVTAKFTLVRLRWTDLSPGGGRYFYAHSDYEEPRVTIRAGKQTRNR